MKILDFQIIGHLASKIQDFQLIIKVYRLDFDNLGLSIRKTLIFTLIIQVFRLIVQEKSKILDYRMKIQDFQRHMSNKSNILDYRYRLIGNFACSLAQFLVGDATSLLGRNTPGQSRFPTHRSRNKTAKRQ